MLKIPVDNILVLAIIAHVHHGKLLPTNGHGNHFRPCQTSPRQITDQRRASYPCSNTNCVVFHRDDNCTCLIWPILVWVIRVTVKNISSVSGSTFVDRRQLPLFNESFLNYQSAKMNTTSTSRGCTHRQQSDESVNQFPASKTSRTSGNGHAHHFKNVCEPMTTQTMKRLADIHNSTYVIGIFEPGFEQTLSLQNFAAPSWA